MKGTTLLASLLVFLFLGLAVRPAFGNSIIAINGAGGIASSGTETLQGVGQVYYLSGSGNSSVPGDTFQFVTYVGVYKNYSSGLLTEYSATGSLLLIAYLSRVSFNDQTDLLTATISSGADYFSGYEALNGDTFVEQLNFTPRGWPIPPQGSIVNGYIVPTPELGTLTMMVTGLCGFAGVVRRKLKRR